MIRVLHVVGKMDVGGIETLLMSIYRIIDREKVQFDFLVHRSEKGFYDDEIERLGGNIYVMPESKPTAYFEYTNALKKFFARHPYEIVHGHMDSTMSIYLSIAKKYGVGLRIAHCNTTRTNEGIKTILSALTHMTVKNEANAFFACSKEAGQWLFGKKFVENRNVVTINNGIDVDKFRFNDIVRDEMRKLLKISNKLVIGHVGRFSEPKNHKFLIDIFYEIYKRKNNAVLLLIGTGSLKKSIEQKVKNMGLSEAVYFMGVRSDISDLLQAMDIFLFPSLFEGLPISLVEAQASGLMCYASNIITREVELTPYIELIDLKKGKNYWAEKVLRHAKEYERKDTSKLIKNAGYDINHVVEFLEKFYIRSNN